MIHPGCRFYRKRKVAEGSRFVSIRVNRWFVSLTNKLLTIDTRVRGEKIKRQESRVRGVKGSREKIKRQDYQHKKLLMIIV